MITKEACTGCGACAVSCPRGCIEMQVSGTGQPVPKVDKRRCTKCGLCVNTCPQNKPAEMQYPQQCYVAWSSEAEDLLHSASGGVGAVLARWQMEHGGVIYGCDYLPSGDLQHFQLRTFADLQRIRGSKYSQSTSWEVFTQIKKLLQEDRTVLFTGTPCQVAGLKKYLKTDYDNLITVDLVCHGTPPNIYLKQHLQQMGVSFPVDRITFRGEFDQKLTVWKDNQIIYQQDWRNDKYFAAFYGNVISNASCYTCRYAQERRVSDLTIGDFWGLGKLETISKKSSRPSLVLVNTKKGQRFFEQVREKLDWESRPVEEGIRGNGRLLFPAGIKREAELFRKVYRSRLFGFGGSLTVTYRMLWLRSIFERLYRKFSEGMQRSNDT